MSNKVTKKSIKKKRIWTGREESFLCELWANKIEMLRGTRKNSHILEEMRLELEAMGGVLVTRDEIKTKMHNLTTRYRKEKEKVGVSGGSPSTWELYQPVNSILGSFKMSNLKDVVDESICDNPNSEDIFAYSDFDVLLDDTQSSFFEESNGTPEETSTSSAELPSTSHRPSTSAAASRNTKNKTRDEILKKILNKIDALDEQQETDRIKADKWEEKMYEIEVEKKNILEKMVEDEQEVKKEMLKFLRRVNQD